MGLCFVTATRCFKYSTRVNIQYKKFAFILLFRTFMLNYRAPSSPQFYEHFSPVACVPRESFDVMVGRHEIKSSGVFNMRTYRGRVDWSQMTPLRSTTGVIMVQGTNNSLEMKTKWAHWNIRMSDYMQMSWFWFHRASLNKWNLIVYNPHSLRVQKGSGPTQPPIQSVPGALSLGVKRPGREADHSPPSSAEVKNAWSYNSAFPIRLHGEMFS
jgi:hypothetical protein